VPTLTGEQTRAKVFRRRRIVAAIFIFLLLFTGFFIYRMVDRARYWSERANEPIRGWMTIGYIARSRRVPPPILKRALGLPPGERERRPLAAIAEEQNRPVDELVRVIEEAIEKERGAPRSKDPGGGR
jgi:hypothetical protein